MYEKTKERKKARKEMKQKNTRKLHARQTNKKKDLFEMGKKNEKKE